MSKLWAYTKFIFGVGWFGGRTYVQKKYGVDIGPSPVTPKEHDKASYIPGYLEKNK